MLTALAAAQRAERRRISYHGMNRFPTAHPKLEKRYQ